MKTIKIETSNGHFEEFNIVPIKCKVGDTIWWNNGTESLPNYYEGEVTEILNEEWWIYDNGDKVYGRIVVKCTTRDSHFYGQFFKIDSDEIIYENPIKPKELQEYPIYFRDAIDKFLWKECNIIGGCCSAQGEFEYNVGRMIAEKIFSKLLNTEQLDVLSSSYAFSVGPATTKKVKEAYEAGYNKLLELLQCQTEKRQLH